MEGYNISLFLLVLIKHFLLPLHQTKPIMKKIINWLNESHRLNHIGGGFLIGFLSNSNYCALLAGVGVAGALEFKDKLWSGKWDWIDFGLTLAGVAAGRIIHIAGCGGNQ